MNVVPEGLMYECTAKLRRREACGARYPRVYDDPLPCGHAPADLKLVPINSR